MSETTTVNSNSSDSQANTHTDKGEHAIAKFNADLTVEWQPFHLYRQDKNSEFYCVVKK